jgi:hypothetical protein
VGPSDSLVIHSILLRQSQISEAHSLKLSNRLRLRDCLCCRKDPNLNRHY